MKKLLISTLSASLLFAGAALASEDHDNAHVCPSMAGEIKQLAAMSHDDHGNMHGQPMKMASAKKTGEQSATFQTAGTVEKIDQSKGAVIISHQAIPALKWPAMTMPFSVSDKALFDKFKAGEKVDFEFKLEGVKTTIVSVK